MTHACVAVACEEIIWIPDSRSTAKDPDYAMRQGFFGMPGRARRPRTWPLAGRGLYMTAWRGFGPRKRGHWALAADLSLAVMFWQLSAVMLGQVCTGSDAGPQPGLLFSSPLSRWQALLAALALLLFFLFEEDACLRAIVLCGFCALSVGMGDQWGMDVRAVLAACVRPYRSFAQADIP